MDLPQTTHYQHSVWVDCARPTVRVSIAATTEKAEDSKCGGTVSADLKKDLIVLLPRLRRFARSLTKSAHDADDLVQDACLKALNSSGSWDRSQPLDRWVFRIMRNHWISEIRKRQVRIGQGQVPADETSELVHRETAEDTLRGTQLRNKIDQLPGDLSVLLLAVSVEGYTYAEAAEIFEIPLGTVMSRIHRARKLLAAQLEQQSGAAQ